MKDTRKSSEKSGTHFGSLLDRPLENIKLFSEGYQGCAFHALIEILTFFPRNKQSHVNIIVQNKSCIQCYAAALCIISRV